VIHSYWPGGPGEKNTCAFAAEVVFLRIFQKNKKIINIHGVCIAIIYTEKVYQV